MSRWQHEAILLQVLTTLLFASSTAAGYSTSLQQCWSQRFAEAFAMEAKEVTDAVRAHRAKLLLKSPTTPLAPIAPRGLSLESCVLGLELATALQQALREGRQIGFGEEGKRLD